MASQLPSAEELEPIEVDGETAFLRPTFDEVEGEWVYELWTAAGEHLEPATPFIGRPTEDDLRTRLATRGR
jgi:hypothetical protein